MVNKKLDQNVNQRVSSTLDLASPVETNLYNSLNSTSVNKAKLPPYLEFQYLNDNSSRPNMRSTVNSSNDEFRVPAASQISGNFLEDNPYKALAPAPVPPVRANPNYNYGNPSYGYGTYGNSSYGCGTYGYVSPYRPLYSSYNYSPFSSLSRPYLPYSTASLPGQSGFLEEAHESTRDAFAGIENIVTAFGSINMMIESTYQALHSSFNAVLSVIDNFSRLKSHFSHILSAFTIVRTVQWMLKKLLYIIGLYEAVYIVIKITDTWHEHRASAIGNEPKFWSKDPTVEAAWNMAANAEASNIQDVKSSKSWPMLAFLVAVYAGPFIMWKFLSSLLKKNKLVHDDWTKPRGSHFYANAIYNYKAQRPDELSFSVGDVFILAPKEMQKDKSWPLAFNGKTIGNVPINYLKVGYNNIPTVPDSGPTKQSINYQSIPVLSEVEKKVDLTNCCENVLENEFASSKNDL